MTDKTLNTNVYIMFDGISMKTVIDGSENGYLKMYPTAQSGNNLYGSQEWSGTGFALRNGYIATNYHVVDNARSIYVRGVNGNSSAQYSAVVVATDKNNDLAILHIEDSSFPGFGSIPYNIKTSQADVGEEIFVLGYPLTGTMGDEIKLTTGVISSKTGFQGDVSLYQISAPIQPGNSGGPLFDYKGNLIGIVNAKHQGAENVGYAVKASYLSNLAGSSMLTSIMPSSNQVAGLPLTSQVKRLKNFVCMISCSNVATNKGPASWNNAAGNTFTDVDVRDPHVSGTTADDHIRIRRVQATSTHTTVDIEAENAYESGGWVCISPNTYISYAGNKYLMKKAENIPISPNKYYFNLKGEKLNFRLVFPPLPNEATEFDLIENEEGEGSAWKFYGIQLR